jgi:hypothetical protein
MKVSLYILLCYYVFIFIDLIPGINNYNPLKLKNRKFGSPYGNINIIGNNNRENNFMKKQKNPNMYNRFNLNNYDSSKPIKLLNNPIYKHSTSTDKVNKKVQMSNNYLYGNQFGINKQSKNKNNVDPKRPSTAPQKYKIKKKPGNNNNVFGYGIKNGVGVGVGGLPHTYSNGFYGYNKRLPSPMISGGQKFGMTPKLKFNSYRLPLTSNNIFTFKSKKGL